MPAGEWVGATSIYPAARPVGGGYFCWGAGNDRGHCTARVDGEDEALILSLLDRLPRSRLPVFLFGYSGGARMAWRAACNASVASRLSGVAAAAGLLPSDLRSTHPPLCDLRTIPPAVVLHGNADTTTPSSEADASVAWLASAANCSKDVFVPSVSLQPGMTADLRYVDRCGGAPRLSLAYYRLLSIQHKIPSTEWLEVVWNIWQSADSGNIEGPGIPKLNGPNTAVPVMGALAAALLGLVTCVAAVRRARSGQERPKSATEGGQWSTAVAVGNVPKASEVPCDTPDDAPDDGGLGAL